MAINQNPAYQARHMFLCGTTGSGKSSFLRRLDLLEQFKRVLIWDPDRDHQAVHCTSQAQFKSTVMRSIASGKPFRVAYEATNATPEEFEFFCGIVWAALDGKEPTAIIIEELADVTDSGKGRGYWGQLTRKSRKYGGVIFAISQRPQEIDKSILNMAAYRWCGVVETEADRKYMSGVLSVKPEDLAAMPANSSTLCHYYLKKPGPMAAQFGKFNPQRGRISL
ncbi:type IV secretory system conjugative DNA transfer family protein [uncultured Microbulbifer sp.]|uniref:type IV secretory system conjugative DNA transfer family protein n=1 Tax=uncultured Microbulbifer sp. TaxID=348147 RepID=UPI00262FD77C|nr:type IV secretory system conjugative DNA transfer family protein [uncultured Microbulbifer sp.]